VTPTCTSATFTIVVSDDPPFFYQWQRNGINIAGATSSAYVVPNGETTNLGVYTVIVSNAFGVILSSRATLALYPSPFICSEPNDQTVSLGSNATFSVRASGAVPFSYQWQFGGTNIAGATSSSYTVQHASADDSGSYRVSITNAYGSTNSLPATLVVNLAPSNLIGPFARRLASVVV